MPRKAYGRPPASEWERQKKNILSLVAQYRWPVVIDRMEKEHGFSASSEQYVAQMRAWGTRKNLKQHEWQAVLRGLDKLVARYQRKIRVRSLGEVVSEEKIKRLRNRYCFQSSTGIPGTDLSNSIPKHVSFEVLGIDDEWSTCTKYLYDSETPQRTTHVRPAEHSSRSMQLLRFENFDEDPSQDACATDDEQQLDLLGARSANAMDTLDLALPNSFPSFGQEANWPVSGSNSHCTFDFGLDIEPTYFDFPSTITQDGPYSVIQLTTLTTGNSAMDLSWDPTNFMAFDPSFLNDLPFQQFRNSVANRGIDLNSFRPRKTTMRSYGASFLVRAFLMDVAETESSRSNIPGPHAILQNPKPKNPLLSFYSLLPGEPNESQADLITKDAMLDTSFIRLLLFSITNGFAGLSDIPVASILRFLTRYGDTDTLFVHVLRSSPNHVAKSLAENLIKVAIEAQQPRIVKCLLDSKLLDVNALVLDAMGWKLTAVERAAQLHDCKTVKVLLAEHADVHKSYASDAALRGPLNLLTQQLRPGETISPEKMDLVDALLQDGAKVDVDMLKRALKRVQNSTLALCLISRFLETHETDPVRDGILPLIALELEEKGAYEATEKIISACRRLHSSACLYTQEGKTEWALVQSAKRGHTGVIQLLLPYTRNLHRVLSASFHGGRSEIVDLVLGERPEFNAPAHSINEEDWKAIEKEDWFLAVTTPLAEALRTRNAKWIQLCEDSATLQHLHLTGHLSAALAAAATIGDLPYVQKLFRHRPEPLPMEMYAALGLSIKNGHHEISSLLIEAGASLHVYTGSLVVPPPPTPLLTAVNQRNPRLVRMILDADTEQIPSDWCSALESSRASSVLAEMINWGDRSIISDFRRAFPKETTENAKLSKLGKGVIKEDFLEFLMDEGLIHEKTLSELLRAAIEEDDIAMVYHLLELGADPSDSNNLCLAVKKSSQSCILATILDHIPKRPRKVRGLGTDAINEAIRLGFPGLKVLDILLASDVVDVHCMTMRDFIYQSPLATAIKMADDFGSEFIIVKRLLRAGCDPNSVVAALDHNLTAVLAAIQTKSVDLVQLLLEHGAEVNTKATRRLRQTPLQAAAESGCLEMVQLLLKRDAEVNALPAARGGGTAMQFAAISGNCNIAAELLKRDADVLMPPSPVRGRWPLEGAAEHGRLDMIGLLLRLKVYNADHCKRAAKFAEKNGNLGCRDLILEHVRHEESMPQFAASELG